VHGKINDEIKREAEKRGIQYLVHFTRSCNISGILKRGILPVVYHQRYEVMSVTNDPNRYDDQTDSVSLSIPFPDLQDVLQTEMQRAIREMRCSPSQV